MSRAHILPALAAVVPSNYGDARFLLAAPRFQQGGGTSCSFGPAWGLWASGCRDARIVNRDGEGCRFDVGQGISKLYNGSKSAGAWIEAGAGRRPKPGDFYLLHGPISGGQWDPRSEHVGTVVDSTGSAWTFADFGQSQTNTDPRPGQQCARRVKRAWDGLHLGSSVAGGAARLLGGWIDADALTYSAAPLYGAAGTGALLPALVVIGGACAAYLLSED